MKTKNLEVNRVTSEECNVDANCSSKGMRNIFLHLSPLDPGETVFRTRNPAISLSHTLTFCRFPIGETELIVSDRILVQISSSLAMEIVSGNAPQVVFVIVIIVISASATTITMQVRSSERWERDNSLYEEQGTNTHVPKMCRSFVAYTETVKHVFKDPTMYV